MILKKHTPRRITIAHVPLLHVDGSIMVWQNRFFMVLWTKHIVGRHKSYQEKHNAQLVKKSPTCDINLGNGNPIENV